MPPPWPSCLETANPGFQTPLSEVWSPQFGETVLATHNVESGQVSGTAACNHYSGTFELSGSQIAFDTLAMTEMACLPEEIMRAESMYANALTRVQTVSLDRGLTLRGDQVELVFEAFESVSDSR